jgi:hypothetical protein
MRKSPLFSRRRGPFFIIAVTVFFFTAQATPAFASGPKILTKLTSGTSLKLQKRGSFYLFGYVTDGSSSSTALQDQLYSVQNADGFTSAAIAEGPTTRDSFSTTTADHELAGVRLPRGYRVPVPAGENTDTGPGSSLSTSVSFSVTESNTIVEVIGLGSSQQTSSLSGLPGLTVQRTSSVEALQVATVSNLAPGPYSVTLNTSETAPGQDPNQAADLLAVFVFEKS